MVNFSADTILEKIKDGQSLERADLRDLVLSHVTLENVRLCRSDLEGTNFEGANLSQADLSCANLREAYMAGADLEKANLQNANLDGANLDGANLQFADLRHANLRGATLERANLKGARLSYAQIEFANLGRALLTETQLDNANLCQSYLGGANLTKANLRHCKMDEANLEEANLNGADLLEAVLTGACCEGVDFTDACLRGAVLENASLANSTMKGADLRNSRLLNVNFKRATLTAAKLFGIEVASEELAGILADWVDFSVEGDGQLKIAGSELVNYYLRLKAGLNEIAISDSVQPKRFFGQGDVLRSATLEFMENSRVEIESYMENCTIHLGHGSTLTVGPHGVLAGCQIIGSGNIIISGKFHENGASPGIVSPRRLQVRKTGTVVTAVQQASPYTEFGFEHGCSLSLKIRKSSSLKGENDARKSNTEADYLGGRIGV